VRNSCAALVAWSSGSADDAAVGAEEKLSLIFDGRVVQGRPMIDDDVDRSGADRADGKASAVQFLDFTLTPDQVVHMVRTLC